MEENDLAIATLLQDQLNSSFYEEILEVNPVNPKRKETKSIIDEFWELNDPNPDIHGLFLEFNLAYFWNKLQGVEVKWSPRMTLCAGMCCYEGHGGLCSVRLSLPLLKLRPRKDLVETLLHEMIHAYLFVTHNNRDHDSHGPEFLKHMYRINKLTGTKITVFHNFHDEVDSYRQHWWRCNGPCRSRPPYYGILRRAMNRAPSPKDYWWEEHQRSCGGVYIKIKEPETTKRKPQEIINGTNQKKSKVESVNIEKFFTPKKDKKVENELLDQPNGLITIQNPLFDNKNLKINIHSLNSQSTSKGSSIIPFSGEGHCLGSSHSKKSLPNENTAQKSRLLSLYSNNQTQRKLTEQGSSEKANQKLRTLDQIWLKKSNATDFKNIDSNFKDSSKKCVHLGNKISTASPLNHIKHLFTNSGGKLEGSANQIRTLQNTSSSTNNEKDVIKSPILQNHSVQKGMPGPSTITKTDLTVPENYVTCPVCDQCILETEINSHLDLCLQFTT